MGTVGPTPFTSIEGLTAPTLEVLQTLGFERCTPVQVRGGLQLRYFHRTGAVQGHG